MAHAVTAAAHGALLAASGVMLATPAGAPELTVGELATRIWQGAGMDGEPHVDLLGIRRGETLNEVLTGAGHRLRRGLDRRCQLGGGADRRRHEPRGRPRGLARGDGAPGPDRAEPGALRLSAPISGGP